VKNVYLGQAGRRKSCMVSIVLLGIGVSQIRILRIQERDRERAIIDSGELFSC